MRIILIILIHPKTNYFPRTIMNKNSAKFEAFVFYCIVEEIEKIIS